MAYNHTAKTLHTIKATLDLLSSWKHKAKIRPLLQRITTALPATAPILLSKLFNEQEARDLIDKLRTIRKDIAAPLQKRQREKQYNISKTIREQTQTVAPSGKNLKKLLKTVKAHTSGIFTLGGTFIPDENNEPTWSTKQSDIEQAMIADMENIFKSRVSAPVSPELRRARDFTTAVGMEGWIQAALGEIKHETTDYKNLGKDAKKQ